MTQFKSGDAVRNAEIDTRGVVVGQVDRDNRTWVLDDNGMCEPWLESNIMPDADGPCFSWVRSPGMVELPEPEDGQQWVLLDRDVVKGIADCLKTRLTYTLSVRRFCDLNAGLVTEPEPVISVGDWFTTTSGPAYVWVELPGGFVTWQHHRPGHEEWACDGEEAGECCESHWRPSDRTLSHITSVLKRAEPATAGTLYKILGVQPGGEA